MARSIYGQETLLDIVQNILEKMTSDEVNSISDTVESTAVANEVYDSFRFITSNDERYQKTSYVTLEAMADVDHFNQLRIPDNVVKVSDMWFDNGCGSRTVPTYVSPEEFVEKMYRSQTDNTDNIKGTAPFGSTAPCFPVLTDQDPCFYTSFDDKHLFFDAVDTSIYQTLRAENSVAHAVTIPIFEMRDDFVIPLDPSDISYLKNEATNASFVHFKGVSNSVAQDRARKQRVRQQNNQRKVGTHTNRGYGPPYGRRARGRSLSDTSRNGS